MDIAGPRTLYSVLVAHAAQTPQQPWIAFENEDGSVRSWTYAGFLETVHQAAHFLARRGIGRGDVVDLHLANHIVFPQMALAASQLGAIVLPTNPASTKTELGYLIEHSGARLIITRAEHRAAFADVGARGGAVVVDVDELEREIAGAPRDAVIPAGGGPDAVVQLLYTSGTTSKPKGVMLTNANLIYGAEVFRGATALRPDDHHLIALPLFHAAAQCHALWPSLVAGCRVTIVPRFSGRRFFAQARRHDATVAALFGAPLRILLAQPEQPEPPPHRLRNITFAQSLTAAQYGEWHRRFRAPLQQLWGMTETVGLPLMSPLAGDRRLGAMGRPVVGYEVRVVDPEGREVAVGESGQLIVRGVPGRSLMLGYLRNEAATAAALRTDGQGTWLYTGDTVRCDQDGFAYFVDRSGDLIKRGGENISSTEVEQVISLLPAVAEVAVIGLPDAMKEEAVAAVVVRKAGATLDKSEIDGHCAHHLSPFKVPTRVHFVETLPRTSVGKVQKQVIRSWFQ